MVSVSVARGLLRRLICCLTSRDRLWSVGLPEADLRLGSANDNRSYDEVLSDRLSPILK